MQVRIGSDRTINYLHFYTEITRLLLGKVLFNGKCDVEDIHWITLNMNGKEARYYVKLLENLCLIWAYT